MNNKDAGLYEALVERNIDRVQASLIAGANPDLVVDGRPAMHFALEWGSVGIAETLYKFGADLNAVDDLGQNALHALAAHTDQKSNQLSCALITLGVDPDLPDNSGRTPVDIGLSAHLREAVEANNQPRILQMLNIGAEWDEDKPLWQVALEKNLAEVFEYEEMYAMPNALGQTPTHIAVQTNSSAIMRMEDVLVRDSFGRSPLFYATDTDVIQYLLGKGALVNEVDNEGNTPLHVVDSAKAAQALIAAGANTSVVNNAGERASDANHNREVQAVISANAAEDRQLRAATRILSRYESPTEILQRTIYEGDLVGTLREIACGADLNWTDENGNNALQSSVYAGNLEVVEAILQSPGVDVMHVNNNNESALHLLAEIGDTRLLDLALEKLAQSADRIFDVLDALEHKNAFDETPLDIAEMLGTDDFRTELKAAHGDAIQFAELHSLALQFMQDDQINSLERLLTNSPNLVHVSSFSMTSADDRLSIGVNETLLSHAAKLNNTQAMTLLIKNGANVDHVNGEGDSVVSQCSTGEALEILVAAGADVNRVDGMGQSALHQILRKDGSLISPEDRNACALVLLNAGADPNLKDSSGALPLDHVSNEIQNETIDMVLEKIHEIKVKVAGVEISEANESEVAVDNERKSLRRKM